MSTTFELNTPLTSKLWDTEFGVVKPDVVGAVGSVKLIKISPFDSSEFRIPSLSLSKSMLSFIPSLSLSLGHVLRVIGSENKIFSGLRHCMSTTAR